MRVVAALLLVTPLVLAGCLGDDADGPGDAADRLTRAGALPDLSDAPAPALDVDTLAAWHADFVQTYVRREVGTPTNKLASDFLVSELEALGWDAQLYEYAPPGIRLPTETGLAINAVVGVRQGSNPDHVVGWVSHYDTEAKTIQGAYDDGSGVAMGIALARELADYDNNKTLLAVFFDAEEIGLVASNYFVQDVVANDDAQWDLVIGHDMVGINCPGHAWPMYQMLAEQFVPELRPIQEALYYEFLDYAPGCVNILDVHDRNSDERRFKEAGIPIIRMAGGRNASDYPQYHMPMDTVDFIHEFVDGEDNWKAGLRTVLEGSYWNVVVFDRLATLEPSA